MEYNLGTDINILFRKLKKVGIKLPGGLHPTVSCFLYCIKQLIAANVTKSEERKINECLILIKRVLDIVVIKCLKNGYNEAFSSGNALAYQTCHDHLQEYIKLTNQNGLYQSEVRCINNDQVNRVPVKRFKFVESLLKSDNLNLPGNALSKKSVSNSIRTNPWSYTTYLLKKYFNSNSRVPSGCDSAARFCNAEKSKTDKTSYGSSNLFCDINFDGMRKKDGNTAHLDNYKELTTKTQKRSLNTTPQRFSCRLSAKVKSRTKNISNLEKGEDKKTESRCNLATKESKNTPKTVRAVINKINLEHNNNDEVQRKRKNRTLDSAELSLNLRQRAKRFKSVTTPKDLKNITRTSKKTYSSGGLNSDIGTNCSGMSNDFSAFTNAMTPTSTMSNRFGKMKIYYRRNLFGVRKVKK